LPRTRNNKRREWRGHSCVDRHVATVLGQGTPYQDDMSAPDFFGMDPAKARELAAALERGTVEGVLDCRPLTEGSTVKVYTLA